MTRETKVGLVISSTFLCLVAVVAYRQLQEGTNPEPSVYAKADGSAPDIPEEPKATEPETSKHNTSPVNAIPSFAKVDGNVKPAVATDATPASGTTGFQATPTPAAPSPTPLTAEEKPETNKNGENNRNKQDGPLTGSPTPLTSTATSTDAASTSPFGPPSKPEPTTADRSGTPIFPTAPGSTPSSPTVAAAPGAVDPVPSPAPAARPAPDATGSNPLVSPLAPAGSSATSPAPQSSGMGSLLAAPTGGSTAPAPLPSNPVPLPAAPEPLGNAGRSGVPTNPVKPDLPPSPTPAAPTSPGTGSPSTALPAAPIPADAGKTTPTAPAAPPPPGPETSSPFAPLPTTGQSELAGSTGTPGAAPIPATGSSMPVPGSPGSEPKPATKLFDPVQGPGSPAPAPGSATIPDSRSTPAPPQPGPGVDSQVKTGSTTSPPEDQFAQAAVNPTPAAASSRPLPPVGAPAAASSPPIAVPAGHGSGVRTTTVLTPQVESYDEETFYCKAPFLTFESISKKFYNSENYAQALLQFNRNHPRRAAALWKDPPALQDDMPVYIPPLRILEKHYSSAIKDYNPLPAVVTPAAAPTMGTSVSSARGGALYVVRKPELIRNIAQTTLGNWERWTEIYTLNNRNFDPSQFVPVGTQLALPADARVPAENKP